MQSDGPYFGLFRQRLDQIFDAKHRLIADRDHVRQRDRTLVHRQVRRQHPRLGDDSSSPVRAIAAMGKRPKRRSTEIVEHTIAIRPYQSHVACSFGQGPFALDVPHLAKPGSVADNATRSAFLQFRQGLDRCIRRYGQKHGIWCFRQVSDTGKTGMPADSSPPRIHWPDLARKTNTVRFAPPQPLHHARQ